MGAIIDIVLPAFCLIGFGYVIARLNYLGEPVGDALADFVFKVSRAGAADAINCHS